MDTTSAISLASNEKARRTLTIWMATYKRLRTRTLRSSTPVPATELMGKWSSLFFVIAFLRVHGRRSREEPVKSHEIPSGQPITQKSVRSADHAISNEIVKGSINATSVPTPHSGVYRRQ